MLAKTDMTRISGDNLLRDSTTGPVLLGYWICPGSSPASAPTPSRAVTYFSLRASVRLHHKGRETAASRLSLGRTPPARVLRTRAISILFKMPTTTTKLSKNETSRHRSTEVQRGRPAICHGQRFTPAPGAHRRSSCRNGPQPMARATSHQAGTDLQQTKIGRKTLEN